MTIVTQGPQTTTFAPHGVLDLPALRAQFPVLSRDIRGKRLTYLDTGATALKPLRVIEAVERYYRSGTANIHRAVHFLSEEATGLYEGVRSTVREFLNAADEREIVLTTGTTAGINLVARSFVRPRLKAGDQILITAMEHHANIVPWQMLREETGCELVVAPVLDDGSLDLTAFKALIGPKTAFISVIWTSNATGVINPVTDMIAAAKKAGVPILIDAAQTVAHEAIDVQRLGCDFLVFSGHKLFGPTGVGVLYGRYAHLEAMPPMIGGGDMIKTVTFEKTVFADPPARFEAGTPDIASVIALGEAVRFIQEDVGFQAIQAHELRLLEQTTAALSEIPGLRVMGTATPKAPVFSLVLDMIHPHDVGSILDTHGVAVRTGHHCAQPLMARFGVPATARASFSIYNGPDDIAALIKALWKTKELFA
jgi:cysteine desulfurase/selenocysteine lyase